MKPGDVINLGDQAITIAKEIQSEQKVAARGMNEFAKRLDWLDECFWREIRGLSPELEGWHFSFNAKNGTATLCLKRTTGEIADESPSTERLPALAPITTKLADAPKP